MSKIFDWDYSKPFEHIGIHGAKYCIGKNVGRMDIQVIKKDGKTWFLPIDDLKALALIFLKATLSQFITKLCDDKLKL